MSEFILDSGEQLDGYSLLKLSDMPSGTGLDASREARRAELRAEIMTPHVIDFDDGEICVRLDGRDLHSWTYTTDEERRQKILQARAYVEGWCDCRGST